MTEGATARSVGAAEPSSRLFVSSSSEPRPRRAGDAVLVVLGVLVVALSSWATSRALRIEESFVDLVDALPSWTDELFAWSYGLAGIFAIWLLVAAIRRHGPRWDIARDVLFAGLTAVALGLVLVRAVDGAWPVVFPELDRAQVVARFPVMRVAVVAAAVAVVGPHVVRPVRRLGWSFVVLVALSGLGLGLGVPSDVIGGVGLGLAAAGAVLLAFGSPAGYPDVARISSDLADLGLWVTSLRPAAEQTWGARTLIGQAEDGRSVLIKVYGPDARDAQLLSRIWRFLWYRDEASSVGASRLEQVEHEALVTLLAARGGVACPDVLAAAVSPDDDAVLVIEERGTPLTHFDSERIGDSLLTAVWGQVGQLHGAGISHGALRAENVRVEADSPSLTSFGAGSLSATQARTSTDVVELLISLADHVGVERCVASAKQGLGQQSLADAIPYIQVPALSNVTRRAIEDPKQLVKDVQAGVVSATGVEAPEPAKLRRVTPRDLIFTSLMVFAAYFLIHQLAGLDLASIWASMKTAELPWLIASLVVAQLLLVPNATGMMAAVTAAIPLRPTVILQSAIQFIGLAVPSSAGRIATNVAYLRKFGVSPVTAITQGALDSFTGFIVQVAILLGALLFGDLSFDLGGNLDLNWALILGIVLAVIVVGAIVVYAVESLRTRLLSVLREATGALAGLFREPRRAIILFGSNFASQLTLAASMWLMIRAFGATASLATALVIVVGAVLLGGVAPTPGGVGVQEAVLAAGLVAAGISQDTAFGIAVTYRLVTFFLPPIWGFASLKWLEKNAYL